MLRDETKQGFSLLRDCCNNLSQIRDVINGSGLTSRTNDKLANQATRQFMISSKIEKCILTEMSFHFVWLVGDVKEIT